MCHATGLDVASIWESNAKDGGQCMLSGGTAYNDSKAVARRSSRLGLAEVLEEQLSSQLLIELIKII